MSDVLTKEEREVVERLERKQAELHLDLLGEARDIIDRLAGIVEKLPVYADTGERFVPLRDTAWTMANGRRWKAMHFDHHFNGDRWTRKLYSTPQAAEAAAKEGE